MTDQPNSNPQSSEPQPLEPQPLEPQLPGPQPSNIATPNNAPPNNAPQHPDSEQGTVTIQGVSKVFLPHSTSKVTAVEDINLHIPAGSFTTLIGPSGCGKSTLLRLVAGLIDPTEGTITVNGKPANQARKDRDYGMAFQTASLFDWRTVHKNIELPLELMGWDRRQRRQRSQEMLELVRLSDFAGSYPRELSGGMQQRVAIARALSFKPTLLLMDEPFGALDEMTREHMQTELLNIWEETRTTVIFITHSISEAVFLSTHVCVMSPRPGRIAAEIDIDLGKRQPETREHKDFFASVVEVREALRSQESEDDILL